jgi:hypothetical protein
MTTSEEEVCTKIQVAVLHPDGTWSPLVVDVDSTKTGCRRQDVDDALQMLSLALKRWRTKTGQKEPVAALVP